MNIFSFILTILSVIYAFLGFKVIQLDKRSPLNRLFFALNLGLIVWSLASVFYISAQDEATCVFWYKLSSVGFYLFIGIALHFFLEYSKKKYLLKKWWLYIILYLPGLVFSYMEITVDFYAKAYSLGSNGWTISVRTDSMWFWASIVYVIAYVGACALISYKFKKTANAKREQKQARVLFITASVSLLAGILILIFTTILAIDIPDVTPISGAIWSVGIFYAIVKYKLLSMTPSFIAENLFQTIVDSVILTDSTGHILSVNPETQRLLEYGENELVGEPLAKIFLSNNKSKTSNISELLNKCPVRNVETLMISNQGLNIPIILSISECKDDYDTRIGYVLAAKDVTEYKLAEEQIRYLATHDNLTGLPNRLMFSQLLNHAIQSAKRHDRQLAVLFFDLDRFKVINDTKGHQIGDLLLKEIAIRLKQSLRADDLVGRLGGDEFLIMLEEVNDVSDIANVAHKLLANTTKPMVLSGDESQVTASIGISIYPKDGEDEETLMKNADLAMYLAKEEGMNNFQFYSPEIQLQSIERWAVEKNLRFALERNELSLHYQAKVDSRTNMITGVEALLRWQNPVIGLISAAQFIRVAEESGLILPIGRWVMKTACAQNVLWQQQGLPAVCMAINLSLRQLTDDSLIEDIQTVLNDTGLNPNLLEFEIAERIVMKNSARIIPVLTKIKSLGARLTIDNFGTNYAFLAQIKNLPIDTIKVDRYFIHNISNETEDKTVIQAIIAMGKTLSLSVIAEGVETQDQVNYLMEHSCEEMQGFYFNRPILPEQFADLLRQQTPKMPD